jgi:hypothetical protein
MSYMLVLRTENIEHILCSHALSRFHTPIKKTIKKCLKNSTKNINGYIDDESIHLHTKLRMNKNFYKRNKKYKIRMQLMRVADWGKQCTRPNYIIIFSFLFLLVETFVHPQNLHEYGCFPHLSIHIFSWFFQTLFDGFFNGSMRSPKGTGAQVMFPVCKCIVAIKIHTNWICSHKCFFKIATSKKSLFES